MLCTEDVIEDNIHDNAGSSVEEKAKTFASLSALLELQQSLSSSNSAEPTAVVDMLDLYLTHAVTQTEQLFEAHLAVANRTGESPSLPTVTQRHVYPLSCFLQNRLPTACSY